jgi:hypothetical protein
MYLDRGFDNCLDISKKYLSAIVIQNIINWYKPTDYNALTELYNYGWITKETLESYYTYDYLGNFNIDIYDLELFLQSLL